MLQIKVGETTAARRRVPLALTVDGVAPWDGTVTGIKAQLSKNGAAIVASTADIVKLAAGVCYVELTAAELSDAGMMIVGVAADTGLAQYVTAIQVVNRDPVESMPTGVGNSGALSTNAIANAVNPTRAA